VVRHQPADLLARAAQPVARHHGVQAGVVERAGDDGGIEEAKGARLGQERLVRLIVTPQQ
jgi:hypothetical protein